MTVRYFAVDDIRSASNSFVTSCVSEDEVEKLYESCSDCMISEITEAEYFEHERQLI